MPTPYRIPRTRGPNVVNANPQRLTSADGTRSALGRNVKCAGPDRTFTVVEAWTLKERREGRWVTVHTHRDRKAAEAWVAPAGEN